jgi:hypothetical protein
MYEEKLKALDGYEKVTIKDSKEVATVVAEKSLAGKVIIEEQQHEDGHFLIFATEEGRQQKEAAEKSLTERIRELETRLEKLEGAETK